MPKSKAAKRKSGRVKKKEQARRQSLRLEARKASNPSPPPSSPPPEGESKPEKATSHDSTVKEAALTGPLKRPEVSPAYPWRNLIYGDGEDPDIEHQGFDDLYLPKYKGCTWVKGILEPPYASAGDWNVYPDNAIEPDFDNFVEELWNWVFDYGGEPLEVVEPRLSSADKQRIIDSLGTYCRCSDWDTLVSRLPPISRKQLPTTLAECLLNKAMFDNIVTHPFYYTMEPDYDGFEVDGVPTTFGADLFQMWKRFRRANKHKAHHMLMLTTQLMNGFDVWVENADDSIGIQSRMLRKSSAIQLATSLLDKPSLLSLLMRPIEAEEDDNDEQPADPTSKKKRRRTKKQKQRSPTLPDHLPDDGRFERLVYIFRQVGELATCLYTFDGKIRGREEPEKLDQQKVKEKMLAHFCSCYDYPDGVLNGRWPILMIRPMITAVATDQYKNYSPIEPVTEILCRAKVVLTVEEPHEFNRTKW